MKRLKLSELPHHGWAVVIATFSEHADGYLVQPKIHRITDEQAARTLADAHRGENVVVNVLHGDDPRLKMLSRRRAARHAGNGRRH
jgi:hypothetical protein